MIAARRLSLALLASLVALSASARAESPAPEPSPVTVQARLLDAGDAEISRARLGDTLTLELVISGPQESELFAPFRPAVGDFKLLSAPSPARERVSGRLVETWRYPLLVVRTGVERVPRIEVPYRLLDGQEGVASSPLLRLDVEGHLQDPRSAALAPPPAPLPVITKDWVKIWGLSVGGALLLALLLALFIVKALEVRFRALLPPPPPRPAIEVALERLAAIDADEALDGAARHAALVDTLRAYLKGRYAFDALEMTSREIVAALQGLDLKGVALSDIESFLGESDLVKFAGYRFDAQEARARAPLVRRIVEETWEPPAPPDAADEPQREAATLRQRFMAAGVDVLAAGLAGLLLFGFLFAQGSLELGWLGLLLTGAILTLRDLFGRSLGKRLLGLSLVSSGPRQAEADPRARLGRNALLLLWPLTLPLEALILREHPLGVRLGDLLADTRVVQGQATRRSA